MNQSAKEQSDTRESARILIVDDDDLILSFVDELLTPVGYRIDKAASAFQARGVLLKIQPDLVILDRHLPDADGLEILKEIRAQPALQNLPVLFLTGEVAAKSKAQGLDTGADDYVAKPFSGEELLARVRALLRRVRRTEEPSTWLRARDLVMDLGSHTVRLRDQAIKLSPREYELLVMFLRNPGRVLQRRFLLESVWGAGAELKMSSKTVDVTVGRLRAALGDWGKYLETVEAYGYRLNADK